MMNINIFPAAGLPNIHSISRARLSSQGIKSQSDSWATLHKKNLLIAFFLLIYSSVFAYQTQNMISQNRLQSQLNKRQIDQLTQFQPEVTFSQSSLKLITHIFKEELSRSEIRTLYHSSKRILTSTFLAGLSCKLSDAFFHNAYFRYLNYQHFHQQQLLNNQLSTNFGC